MYLAQANPTVSILCPFLVHVCLNSLHTSIIGPVEDSLSQLSQ